MLIKESLRRGTFSLAVAGGVESGLQLAIPIILVRHLDATTFGQYRLLWLLAGTALAIAPAFMPQSLFYFLPRAEHGQKRLLVGNVLVYLVAAGFLVGILAAGWNPWLLNAARTLFFQTRGISSVFLALWVVASMLDVLPTADGRACWQSNAIIGLAILRALLLVVAALSTADFLWIAFAMLMAAFAKITLLAYYIYADTGNGRIAWQMATLRKQLFYALPFAIGNALFLLRIQADQWVVVSMLSPALYATFSIGATFLSVSSLVRQPINNAMMPRLNSAHACGDLVEISRLIAKGNAAAVLLLVPIAGGLLATAPELIKIIYTSRYQQAAPVMQVYLIGVMISVFAVGHLLPALGKGRFAVLNSACCLVLSVIFSVVGVKSWDLVGAAVGSVLTLMISELWALRVVSRALDAAVFQLVAWGAVWPAMLATCLALGGVAALSIFVSWHAFPMLLLKGAVYLIIFAPCFILTGGRKQLDLLIGWHRNGARTAEGGLHETV